MALTEEIKSSSFSTSSSSKLSGTSQEKQEMDSRWINAFQCMLDTVTNQYHIHPFMYNVWMYLLKPTYTELQPSLHRGEEYLWYTYPLHIQDWVIDRSLYNERAYKREFPYLSKGSKKLSMDVGLQGMSLVSLTIGDLHRILRCGKEKGACPVLGTSTSSLQMMWCCCLQQTVTFSTH